MRLVEWRSEAAERGGPRRARGRRAPSPPSSFSVSDDGVALADARARRKKPAKGGDDAPGPQAASVAAVAAPLLAAGAAALDPRSLALATAERGDAESAWRTYSVSEAFNAGVTVADGPAWGKAAPAEGGTRVTGHLVAGVDAASARATVDACLDLVAPLVEGGVAVGVEGVEGGPPPLAPACPTARLAGALTAWLTRPGSTPPLVSVGAAGPAVDGCAPHLARGGVDARVALVVPQGPMRLPRLLADALAGVKGEGPHALLIVAHDGGLRSSLPTLSSLRAAPWKAYGLPVASLTEAGPAPGVGRVAFARGAAAALALPALVVVSYSSPLADAATAAARGKPPKLSPQLARRLAAAAAGSALAALRSALPPGHLLPPADRHLLASLPFAARALAEVGSRAAPGSRLAAALGAAVEAAGGAAPRDALLAALVDAADRALADNDEGEEGEERDGEEEAAAAPRRAARAPVPLAVTHDDGGDDDGMWAPLAHEVEW